MDLAFQRGDLHAVPASGAPWRRATMFAWQALPGFSVFCTLFGALIATDPVSGGAPTSWRELLMGIGIAVTLFTPPLLSVSVASAWPSRTPFMRAVVLGIALAAGLALGGVAATATDALFAAGHGTRPAHTLAPLSLLLTAALGLAIHLLLDRERWAATALDEEMQRRSALANRIAEAQLQMLQSQVEPHFLFNSLAHVRRLYRVDRRAGHAMLRNLRNYVGDAHAATCGESVELARDAELAAAYLSIQKIRMGARLVFDLRIDSAVRSTRVPPMTLTTLVENAVKHGISRLPAGGSVAITAAAVGREARIEVVDTGGGFRATLGSGVGLANVRARLALLHGDAAELSLSPNQPSGVRVTLTVPLPVGGD